METDKAKKKSTSLRLDADVLKQLKLLAVKQDTSIQAIVEKLIKDYIKKIEKSTPRR